MKKYIGLLVLATVLCMACTDDDSVTLTPTDRGTVTDSDGNPYAWVRIGDLQWTTTNARNGASMAYATYNLYGYDDYVFDSRSWRKEIESEYIPEWGNLMTYETAIASAPDGWRLPTDEDWMKLEKALGMSDSEAHATGWRGSGVGELLMQTGEGTPEVGLQVGGALLWSSTYGMRLSFLHQKEMGYYWTSTIDPTVTDYQGAYYRKVVYGRTDVAREVSKTDKYFSVRWVRDAK